MHAQKFTYYVPLHKFSWTKNTHMVIIKSRKNILAHRVLPCSLFQSEASPQKQILLWHQPAYLLLSVCALYKWINKEVFFVLWAPLFLRGGGGSKNTAGGCHSLFQSGERYHSSANNNVNLNHLFYFSGFQLPICKLGNVTSPRMRIKKNFEYFVLII